VSNLGETRASSALTKTPSPSFTTAQLASLPSSPTAFSSSFFTSLLQPRSALDSSTSALWVSSCVCGGEHLQRSRLALADPFESFHSQVAVNRKIFRPFAFISTLTHHDRSQRSPSQSQDPHPPPSTFTRTEDDYARRLQQLEEVQDELLQVSIVSGRA
jgi:hypothetical protein